MTEMIDDIIELAAKAWSVPKEEIRIEIARREVVIRCRYERDPLAIKKPTDDHPAVYLTPSTVLRRLVAAKLSECAAKMASEAVKLHKRAACLDTDAREFADAAYALAPDLPVIPDLGMAAVEIKAVNDPTLAQVKPGDIVDAEGAVR